MENNNNRTLKEVETLDLEPAQTYELKSELMHLLPKFHGLAGEDPHKHLKEFHMATRDPIGLHKDESILVLSLWSGKRLVVSAAGDVYYMEGDEANIPREVLPGIQNNDHLEGDLWNPKTFKGNVTRVLRKIQ
ncbi:hypothetical protein CR513_58360, partial [Mucuna pruriens]